MPTEVNESIRVLTAQIEECKMRSISYKLAFDEFQKCENTINNDVFIFINSILKKAIDFYDSKMDESIQARKEIMDKFGIMYNKEE